MEVKESRSLLAIGIPGQRELLKSLEVVCDVVDLTREPVLLKRLVVVELPVIVLVCGLVSERRSKVQRQLLHSGLQTLLIRL